MDDNLETATFGPMQANLQVKWNSDNTKWPLPVLGIFIPTGDLRKSDIPPILYDVKDRAVIAKMRGWPKGGVRRWTQRYLTSSVVGEALRAELPSHSRAAPPAFEAVCTVNVPQARLENAKLSKKPAALDLSDSDTSCYLGDSDDNVYDLLNAAACWVFRENADKGFPIRYPPYRWIFTKEGRNRIVRAFCTAKPSVVNVWNEKIPRGKAKREVNSILSGDGPVYIGYDEATVNTTPVNTNIVPRVIPKPAPLPIRLPTEEELAQVRVEYMRRNEYHLVTFDKKFQPILVLNRVRLNSAYRTGVSYKVLSFLFTEVKYLRLFNSGADEEANEAVDCRHGGGIEIPIKYSKYPLREDGAVTWEWYKRTNEIRRSDRTLHRRRRGPAAASTDDF